MSRKVHKRGAVAPAMNITPLIDVVFLLSIFFMIVTKIGSDERTPMIVPQLQDPQAEKLEAPRRVLVNVARVEPNLDQRKDQMSGPDKYDHLAGPGQAEYVKVGGYKKFKLTPEGMKQVTEVLKADKKEHGKVEVLLRADSALHYRQVAPVMNAITQAQISTVNVVAYEKEIPF